MKTCKTCKWWEPWFGTCTNGDSPFRGNINGPGITCEAWERHFCKGCGGTLEARSYNGKVYYYCYSCHFEFPYEP